MKNRIALLNIRSDYLRASIRSICRYTFIVFLVLCFLLMQALPVVAAFANGMNPLMSAGQEGRHSKLGCRCCNPSTCPCDLKKDQACEPMSLDLAFMVRPGNHVPEEAGFLQESFRQSRPLQTTRSSHWVLARAPCPLIYLATLNLLC
jgi:hypothetical protein